MNETLRMRLLASIIDQIQDKNRAANHVGNDLNYIDVTFFSSKSRARKIGDMSATKAMDCLMNDVYIFEDFDLRSAQAVGVYGR